MYRIHRLKSGEVLLVREARPEDADELHEFYKRVTEETHYLITLPEEIRDVSSERYLIRVYAREWNRLYLVGLVKSRIIAVLKFAGMRRKRLEHSGEMSIAVLRDYWGMGIGSVLMEEMLIWAESVGIERIELSVLAGNERAIKLYEKYGFVVEGLKRKAVKFENGYGDLIMMAKFL